MELINLLKFVLSSLLVKSLMNDVPSITEKLNTEQIERVCISPNSVCNLSCKYCYFYNNPSKDLINFPKLSCEEIFEILEKIFEYSQLPHVKKKIKVNFVGSGEPLLSWDEIYCAVKKFRKNYPGAPLKFYTVTNGLLLKRKILREMKEINLIPSISIDGPKEIHDKYRIYSSGKGSFDKVIQALHLMKENGFELIINTTVTPDLITNIDKFMDFLIQEKITKVVFDRLVDVPHHDPQELYDQFYLFLQEIIKIKKNKKMDFLEVGNLEAYRRSLIGKPDKVCTMFGSSCGAGINFIIYMQREVYPCGRMFGEKKWLLGALEDDLISFQKRMLEIMPPLPESCLTCEIRDICVKDCILEQTRDNYQCQSRKEFLNKLTLVYRDIYE